MAILTDRGRERHTQREREEEREKEAAQGGKRRRNEERKKRGDATDRALRRQVVAGHTLMRSTGREARAEEV